MKRFITVLSNSRRGLLLLALVLFLGFGLTACKDTVDEPPPQDTPPPPPPPPPPPGAPENQCPPNCVLTVTLPADPGAPPTVSHPIFRAQSGSSVTISLVDEAGQPAQAGTRLVFTSAEESAFVNPANQPMPVVPLVPGNQIFKVRSYGDGACRQEHEPPKPTDGCKYDVVNKDNPGRKVLDPQIIIWQ